MTFPDPSPLDLKSRATFRHWSQVPLRYVDQDPLGHVNNAALPMCLEQARVELISPLMKAHAGPDADIIIARLLLDYVQEITYPGTIEIGMRLVRIGTKSFVTAHGMFMQGSDTCVGTAESVLVMFDTRLRTSIVPDAGLRAALERLMA